MLECVLLLVQAEITRECPERVRRALAKLKGWNDPQLFAIKAPWNPTPDDVRGPLMDAIRADGVIGRMVPSFDGEEGIYQLPSEPEWGEVVIDPEGRGVFSVAFRADAERGEHDDSVGDSDEERDPAEAWRDEEDDEDIRGRVEQELSNRKILEGSSWEADLDDGDETLWLQWVPGGARPHLAITFRVIQPHTVTELELGPSER